MNTRFSDAIISENTRGFVAVIPDIKCISPKEGDLLQGRDPVDLAKHIVSSGAPLLSVVTETEHFHGSSELLLSITQALDVPVLRKDFITGERMLEETVELGASSVLLICSITDEKNLCLLYEKAIKLGLEPFVEVHTTREMQLASSLGARLIGVNNRDIATLELDSGGPSRTAALASGTPAGALLVSESGILTQADAKLAACAGVNAVLVGTALLKAREMGAMYQSFRVELRARTCDQP